MFLPEEEKNEIMETVALGFESGEFPYETKHEMQNTCQYPCAEMLDEAWDYYEELVELGPVGFYERFRDEYDFDISFIREYVYAY